MKMNKEKITTYVSFILLIACICMIIAGIKNGEAALVLSKARSICTECIGIW